MTTVLLLLAVVLSGLNAGLFAAFSYAVMPGLRHVGDNTMVTAMNGINGAILNPVFWVVFFGPLLVTAGAGVAVVVAGEPPLALIVAVVLHVATVAITVRVNVPLNLALAETGVGESSAEVDAAARRRFEGRWLRWNHLRSLTSLAAFIVLVVAAAW